jgi:hypothetical protein
LSDCLLYSFTFNMISMHSKPSLTPTPTPVFKTSVTNFSL